MQSGKPSANELSSVRPLQHAFLRMERVMGIALRLNPSYSLLRCALNEIQPVAV